MKFSKTITSILIFAILFTFVSCANKTNTDEENTSDAIVSADISDKEEESSIHNETVESTSKEAESSETKKADEKTTLPVSTTESATTATTTTAPAANNDSKPENAESIAEKIAGKTSLFEETLTKSSSKRALSLFGIAESDVTESAYYAASAAVAEEVLVVKAANQNAVDTIKTAIADRIEIQIEDYADYVPKEVPKLKSAIVYTNGNYVVFCVSANNTSALSVIKSLF